MSKTVNTSSGNRAQSMRREAEYFSDRSLIVAFVCVLAVLIIIWVISISAIHAKSETVAAFMQAAIGTAIVAASAYVAIVIARAALKTSRESAEASERAIAATESSAKATETASRAAERAAQLEDPDYQLAKEALRAYQKLSFLTGSLMPAYRLWKQQTDRTDYVATHRSEAGVVPAGGPVPPDAKQAADKGAPNPTSASTLAWHEILRQLRELFADTAFTCALYEGARLADACRAAGGAESEEQALRKVFVGMATAISADPDASSRRHVENYYLRVLASTYLLTQTMLGGIRKAKSAYAEGKFGHQDNDAYPLMNYLARWADQIPRFDETDRSLFDNVARTTFNEFAFWGVRHGLDNSVKRLLAAVLDNEPDKTLASGGKNRLGLHKGLLVATLDGDESTLMAVERMAEIFARTRGLTPERVVVTSRFQLPRSQSDDKKFWILTCTPSTLHWLFAEGVLYPDTMACVIVDGLRAPGLEDVEDFFVTPPALLEEISSKQNQIARMEINGDRGSEEHGKLRGELEDLRKQLRDLPAVLDVAGLCSNWAASHNFGGANREDGNLAVVHPGDESLDPELGAGPRVAWVGIDYRELGSAPPTRLGNDFSCELWAIFQRESMCLGIDAAALTKLRPADGDLVED